MKQCFSSCALALWFANANGQAASYSPSSASSISYAVSIPSTTVSSGTGDIFFQLSAPSTYQWVGLGMGTQMSGANIFVMYADGNGNVTISPRTGTGHVQPQYNSNANLTLLEGSGIVGSNMVANVRCTGSGCGETLNVTSSSSPWICAWKSGSALDSTSLSATITQHDAHKQFTLDLTQAVISTDANPFIASTTNTSSSASGTASATPLASSTSSSSSSSPGSDTGSASAAQPNIYDNAHGVIMAVTVVLLLPCGALIMRLFGSFWFHAAFQMFCVAALIAGLGLGIHLAQITDQLFSNAHSILGLIIIILFLFQPLGGLLHHRQYVKTQSRTVYGRAHVWFGRFLLALAIINGGLGLSLAANSNAGYIVYGVLAGVVGLGYIGVVVITEGRKRKREKVEVSSSH